MQRCNLWWTMQKNFSCFYQPTHPCSGNNSSKQNSKDDCWQVNGESNRRRVFLDSCSFPSQKGSKNHILISVLLLRRQIPPDRVFHMSFLSAGVHRQQPHLQLHSKSCNVSRNSLNAGCRRCGRPITHQDRSVRPGLPASPRAVHSHTYSTYSKLSHIYLSSESFFVYYSVSWGIRGSEETLFKQMVKGW